MKSQDVVAEALRRGWAAAGVSEVRPYPRARQRTLEAIRAGRMGGMGWMSEGRARASADLGRSYPWARSLLALAWPYRPAVPLGELNRGSVGSPPAAPSGRPRGRMAAYAQLPGSSGAPEDYHRTMAAEVDALVRWMQGELPGLRAKRFIDHGWAIDRAAAERAGLGFCGKNTTLITGTAGSYVLLGEVLLSAVLDPTPRTHRNCGTCRACLPACPTGALLAPGVMDARRCISYLTIEHRGPIAEELRPLMGTWIFGCDLCQEACPINQRLAPGAEADTGPSTAAGPVPFPDLVECLELDEEAFAVRFRGTAVARTRREGLARNAAIALGNAGDPAAIPALRRAASGDPDAVVREAAAWALARLAGREAAGSALDGGAQGVEVVPAE